MENRSHALLAGLFTLALLAAAAVAAIWIGRSDEELAPYDLVSRSSVNGLSAQSMVKYQGVNVGRVQSLSVSREQPGQVRIRIGVSPDTPVTAGTWAELAVQGVTGISHIELRDDGSAPQRLDAPEGMVAVIPLRPGFFDRLESRGGAIMGDVERVAEQMEKLLSEQNVQALTATLQNVADLSQSLKTTADGLAPLAGRAAPLADSMASAARQADQAAREVAGLARSARETVALLNAPDGPLRTAADSLRDVTWATAQMGSDTLPQLGQAAQGVGSAAHSLAGTARLFSESPQSLLFGPPPVQPGPGEQGFRGFAGEGGGAR